MKVIELLNKIANGEELPSKIMYQDKIYYMVGNNDYENYEYEEEPTLMYALVNTHHINDEIEIIEEDTKIEKLKLLQFSDLIDMDLDKRIDVIKENRNKINEIIDIINRGDKNV